jgi:hypothetical protein
MPPGMRFVRRGPNEYRWVHPLDMRDTDTDCTDMSDAEFEMFVVDSD